MHRYLHNFFNIFSLVVFVYDVVSDVALAISYAARGDDWYFALTLTAIIVPALITNVLSSIAAKPDDNEHDCIQYLRPTSHCCLMGMMFRYIRIIYQGLRNPEIFKNKDDETMKKNLTDVGQLSMLEAFLEAAPQLVLQLYIVITNAQVIRPEFQTGDYAGIPLRNITASGIDDAFFRKLSHSTTILQMLSIGGSIISMSWAVANNNQNVHLASKAKTMPLLAVAYYFLWHLFTISARVLALALFASALTYWSFVVMALHILGVAISLCCTAKDNRDDDAAVAVDDDCKCCSCCWKNLLRGFFSIFTFVAVIKEPENSEYYAHFILELVENSLLIGLWCWVIDPTANSFFYLALAVHYGGVGLGFLFMMAYVRYFLAKRIVANNNPPNSVPDDANESAKIL